MKIGVLDIQGSVEEHFAALEGVRGVEPILVKTVKDLDRVAGLIMPGGESTTIGKLLRIFGLREEIIKRVVKGNLAVWGTCAGAILMAKKLVGKESADSLALMDITIERNAYGRQVESFETEIEFNFGVPAVIPAIFIRAPKILEVGKGVKVLAKYEGEIVAARKGKLLVTNFHPELTEGLEVHKYFAEMCR